MKFINNKYYGLSTEIGLITDAEDLAIFNALDSGTQYRFFEGRWYRQPIPWTDKDDVDASSSGEGGGGGGAGYSVTHNAIEVYDGTVQAESNYSEVDLQVPAKVTDLSFFEKIQDAFATVIYDGEKSYPSASYDNTASGQVGYKWYITSSSDARIEVWKVDGATSLTYRCYPGDTEQHTLKFIIDDATVEITDDFSIAVHKVLGY